MKSNQKKKNVKKRCKGNNNEQIIFQLHMERIESKIDNSVQTFNRIKPD